MKRIGILLGLFILLSLPLFAQVRLDLGIDIPRGVGAVSGNEFLSDPQMNKVFTDYILPLPEAGLYYQFGENAFRAGVGLRAFTLILVTIFWPNAFIEADIWKFTLAFQMGGGLFGVFGLANDMQSGKVFLPDLSLWYRIGNNFRLGGGAIGVMLPESTTMGFLYYLGGKFNILFK